MVVLACRESLLRLRRLLASGISLYRLASQLVLEMYLVYVICPPSRPTESKHADLDQHDYGGVWCVVCGVAQQDFIARREERMMLSDMI